MAQTSSLERAAAPVVRRGPLARLAALPLDMRLLAVIAVLALALRLWPLGGAPTDYDEGVYWQSLRSMAAGHALYTQIFSSQPPGFLLSVYPFYAVLGHTLAAARFGVVVYSLVGLAAMYAAGRMLGGRWVGLAAFALLALDPTYVKESHTLQAEAPAIAFEMLCVALAIAASLRLSGGRANRGWAPVLAAASGAALAFGMLIKLFDVVALLPALLCLLAPVYPAFRLDGRRGRLRGRAELIAGLRAALPPLSLFAAGFVLASLIVLVPFFGRWDVFYAQVVSFHLAAEHAANQGPWYNITFMFLAGELYPLALLALVGIVVAVRRRQTVLVLTPALWAGVSFVLLLGQQPLFDHHRVLLSPALALTAACALPLLFATRALNADHARNGKRRMGTPTPAIDDAGVSPAPNVRPKGAAAQYALAALLAVLLLGVGLSGIDDKVAAAAPTALQMQVARAIEGLTVPADVVASDDQYVVALAGRNVPPELVDTSLVRIKAGDLRAARLEAILIRDDVRVILFSSGRFALIPGFEDWVRANYTQVLDLGDGRGIFVKAPRSPVVTT
ncbi:MAG TPA: glycosyltransferase family 39 protein [Ktedonobacterales bacterium]|nr:glycosyltransferase family 39 protein [Ktedonobacterales bacterium]